MTHIVEFYFYIKNLLRDTYTLRILENFFELFYLVGPYLLLSVAINVFTVRRFRTRKINFLFKNKFVSILAGAAIGLLSPMPTYAALPVGVSLAGAGVPFSAVMAFVIASPLMNPSIFFLTATQLGAEMAAARTLTAFIMAVAGGMLADKYLTRPEQQTENGATPSPQRTLWKDIYRNLLYIGKTFSISIFISAAVKALVPAAAVSALLGGNTAAGTLIAIGMGVPLYTCGGAAIPFMATLGELGMGKGPMLAFFLSGPATKAETLYAYHANLGAKAMWFFLALTFLSSFLFGMMYSAV